MSTSPQTGTRTGTQTATDLLSELRAGGQIVSAMIEISDRCNEVCVHCYQVQGQKGEMDTAQVKAVMDGLAEAGVLRLTISGGEPTLRHDFLELLAHARALGFLVTLFTNGLSMTAELARKLADLSVFSVEISLYGTSAEPHDFVTGVPGSFERTVAGIRHLTALGVDVVAKTPAMSVQQDGLGDYETFVRGLGASPSVAEANLHAREDGDRTPEAMRLGDDAFDRRLRLLARARSPQPQPIPNKSLDRPVCGAARSVHVEPNGKLQPCTMLPVELGDATAGDLRGYRERPAVTQLTALTWGDVHGCRDCDLIGYCAHCYARALDEVGDALAPYPTACQAGRMRYVARRQLPTTLLDGIPALGPYRIEPDGRLGGLPHRISADDDALAQALGWARRTGFVAQSQPASAQPGDLVQLRRPGRKAAKTHRMPGRANVGVREDY